MHLKMDNKTTLHLITSLCPHSLPAGDYIISRTSAGVKQHPNRPRVLGFLLFTRVDAQQGDIQLDNGDPGPLSMGSVRNLTQPPVELVFELEARPVCNGDEWFFFALVGRTKEDMPFHHLP